MKEYRIREIAFTGRVHRWFHYAKPISSHKHQIDYSLASILKRCSLNFDYLKRLKIGPRSTIDLGDINKFVHLQELDIDLKNYENKKSRTLSLANLEVLYIFVPNHLPYLELDTPRLAKVCTCSLEMFEFVYPESVRCIQTFFHAGKMPMFRNLEYLTFTDCYNQLNYPPSYVSSQNFKDFSVLALKKLKEISFYYNVSEYRKKNLSNFKEITTKLLALRRPHLKVFWLDVQVTDMSVLTEYERMEEHFGSVVAFQLRHYEILKERVEHLWSYGFNMSMNKLLQTGLNPRSNEFKSKFLSRYSIRKIIITGKVEEREFLLELITRSPDLFSLNFDNSRLGQSFFDQMADTIRLKAIPLRRLAFGNSSSDILNFDFVLGLRDLALLETDQRLSKELVSMLLRMPQMDYIAFCSAKYRIERLSSSRFRLNGELMSLQELFLELFKEKPEVMGT